MPWLSLILYNLQLPLLVLEIYSSLNCRNWFDSIHEQATGSSKSSSLAVLDDETLDTLQSILQSRRVWMMFNKLVILILTAKPSLQALI